LSEKKVKVSIPDWLKEDIEEFLDINEEELSNNYSINNIDDFMEEAIQFYIDYHNLLLDNAWKRNERRQVK